MGPLLTLNGRQIIKDGTQIAKCNISVADVLSYWNNDFFGDRAPLSLRASEEQAIFAQKKCNSDEDALILRNQISRIFSLSHGLCDDFECSFVESNVTNETFCRTFNHCSSVLCSTLSPCVAHLERGNEILAKQIQAHIGQCVESNVLFSQVAPISDRSCFHSKWGSFPFTNKWGVAIERIIVLLTTIRSLCQQSLYFSKASQYKGNANIG